ncbi:MAG: methionyl-tRNA formyltransferase [Verrucomicrobiales bacterium]|nr:methionyl-tRNA formyltransferase [Verrucomicrobiales bacterium]
MRIIWMGAGEIGLPSLKWLIDESGHEVVAVFTQPDRPVGRKQVLTATVTKLLAVERGIPVFQPENLRRQPELLQSLQDLQPDLIVVMAYGCFLPRAVIEVPSLACINLHASLLPKHRGAAPIQAAIMAGDEKSGITVMHIAAKLDAGDMICKQTLDLAADETGGCLHDRLAQLGPQALAAALPLLESGEVEREVQDESQMTHIGKLGREDGVIDWSRSAVEIDRLVRAFDPWPGTKTQVLLADGKKAQMKIFPPVKAAQLSEVEMLGFESSPAGTILPTEEVKTQGLRVKTGDGVLQLFQLQLEGRARMDADALLRGRALAAGSRLGK